MEDGVGLTEIGDMVFSKEDDKVGEAEEEKSGVIRTLFSALVSTNGDDHKDQINGGGVAMKEEKDDGEKGAGILNNLISGILHPSGGGDDKHEENKMGGGGGGGGGGLIDNIVSHLPTPLAGDTTTASEEASILIHSIVHD